MFLRLHKKDGSYILIPKHLLVICFELSESDADALGYKYQISYRNVGISKLTGELIDEIVDKYTNKIEWV